MSEKAELKVNTHLYSPRLSLSISFSDTLAKLTARILRLLFIFSACEFIRNTSGDITSTIWFCKPALTNSPTWVMASKQSDLPPPVGTHTMQSCSATTTAHNANFWCVFNDGIAHFAHISCWISASTLHSSMEAAILKSVFTPRGHAQPMGARVTSDLEFSAETVAFQALRTNSVQACQWCNGA